MLFEHDLESEVRVGHASHRSGTGNMSMIEATQHRVKTREDLVSFLADLRRDLRENADTWENDTLEAFLEALQAVFADWNGRFANRGEEVPDAPTWKLIAEALLSATIYE